MCFAPQPRALFDCVHCQNCSGREALLHFDFEMCFAHLRATAGCNFSSLMSPDYPVPSALASLLCDPSEPQHIGKHSVSQLYIFARFDLLSSDFFSDSFSSLLCVCPYCRKSDF